MGETIMAQHKELAAGRWQTFSLCEQMANIGSEVSRAITWKKKGNAELSREAAIRAIELVELSLDFQTGLPRLKEFARLREALLDYFFGENEFNSSDRLWERYFYFFTYGAALERAKRSGNAD